MCCSTWLPNLRAVFALSHQLNKSQLRISLLISWRCPVLADLDMVGIAKQYTQLDLPAFALGCLLVIPHSEKREQQIQVNQEFCVISLNILLTTTGQRWIPVNFNPSLLINAQHLPPSKPSKGIMWTLPLLFSFKSSVIPCSFVIWLCL